MRVGELVRSGEPALVVTPNTDHLIRWRKSVDFRTLYARAALVVVDGMPLVWLSRLQDGQPALRERVTGVDLIREVCRLHGRDISIFMLGSTSENCVTASRLLNDEFQVH